MSYRRRRFAIILIVIAAVLAAITGSGAFTSVSAQRTAQVAVTGDASALLGLEPHSGPNGLGAYAQTTNGQLELVIDGTNTPGSGVNLNAETIILDVFNMTNQGTQNIEVWVEKSGNNSNLIRFETATGDQLDNTSAAAQPLTTGATIEVAVIIDTRGASLSSGDILLNSITIHANSTA